MTTDAMTGDRVPVPGQAPLDRLGRLVHADDLAAQLCLALANLEAALAHAGLRPAELTDVVVSTTDVPATQAVLDTLAERFAEVGAAPVTTLVRVDRLPVPGQLVALDAAVTRTTTTHHLEVKDTP